VRRGYGGGGVHLIDRWQAHEGEMDLRQRLFARAPKFPGAAPPSGANEKQ
jgi:hypothetical protein